MRRADRLFEIIQVLRRKQRTRAADLAAAAKHNAQTYLITTGLIFFGIVVAIGTIGGYLLARQALRPIAKLTQTARALSTETLDQRINLGGPDDELRELADTFDDMLARLDAAFDSQRMFVANASHELRTPLSVIRIELDVYRDHLSGLVTAEVEFDSEDAAAAFAAPSWLGREITEEPGYKNQRLAVDGLPQTTDS